MPTTGADTSFMACIVASCGLIPCSMWCMTASTTTIASSTTMPMARTRPNIESVFTEKPSIGKKMKVPMSEHGTGEERDDRRAQVLQEDEDDERDEHDRLEEGVEDRLDRGLDRGGRVVDDRVVHVGGEEALRRLHGFVDRLRGLELVGPGQQVHGHGARGLAVQAPERVVVLRAELHAADVLDPDLAARLRLADDDVRELVLGDRASGGAHRVGELLVLRGGAPTDATGRRLEVLLLDGGHHVRRRESQLRQLVGPEPDPHPVVGAAEEVHLGDPGDAQ